jgi:hypothetical protein
MRLDHFIGCCAIVGVTALAARAFAGGAQARYQHDFQRPYGQRAVFHVSGPATGSSPDVQGDAMIESIEYGSGEKREFFYKPVAVLDVEYDGEPRHWSARGGHRCEVGLTDRHFFGAAEGSGDEVSATDVEHFQATMLEAFDNNNLNNYVDLAGAGATFSFVIAFDRVVKDDDPAPDDFGEILYFERGTGFGNSWLKLQAVDASGNALGPWLVVGPHESWHTTPKTTVMRVDQRIGAAAIDVSRLGVSEFQYLRISNDVAGEPAYQSDNGDLQPDFKIMAVITDEKQLQYEILGGFD